MCIGTDAVSMDVAPHEDPKSFVPVHCYMFATAGAQIIEVAGSGGDRGREGLRVRADGAAAQAARCHRLANPPGRDPAAELMAGPLRLALSQFGARLGDVDAQPRPACAALAGGGRRRRRRAHLLPRTLRERLLLAAEEYSPALLRVDGGGRASARGRQRGPASADRLRRAMRAGAGQLAQRRRPAPSRAAADSTTTRPTWSRTNSQLFAAGDEFVVDRGRDRPRLLLRPRLPRGDSYPRAARRARVARADGVGGRSAASSCVGLRRGPRAIENIAFVVCVNQSGTGSGRSSSSGLSARSIPWATRSSIGERGELGDGRN